MSKKRFLALLTVVSVAAVGLVAAVSYDRWDWNNLPVLVANAPQSEEPKTNTSLAPPTPPTTSAQATPQPESQQAATGENDVKSESPQKKSIPVAPKTSSSAAVETKPQIQVAEPPKAQEVAKAEPKPKPSPAETNATEEKSTSTTGASDTGKQPEPELSAASKIQEKPAFDTVRVEKSGEALAAGTAAPGAEIVLKHNGKPVGKSVANQEGAWVIIPDAPLPPGLGQLTAEQKMPGALTSEASEQSVAVVVPDNGKEKGPLVALVEPGAPTEVLQKPSSKSKEESPGKIDAKLPVTLDAVDYNDRGDIVFSGRASSGANVRLYVDNKPVGDAAAAPDGKWNYLGKSEIPPGSHSLRIDQINEKGKVVNRIELPFHREEPERVVALRQPEPEPPQAVEPAPAAKVQEPPEPSKSQSIQTPAESPPAVEQSAPREQQAVAAAPVTGTEPVQLGNGKIVIQPGNNLWRLSRVIYGRGTNYTVIYEANKEQIRDPDLIYPGQIFTTPNATPPEKIDPKQKKPFSAEAAGASR